MEATTESPLWQQWEAYHQELARLEAKVRNGKIAPGKRERCEYRLRDLQARLIPDLRQRMGI